MSNPLFMNDIEELRFGMNEGMQALVRSSSIKQACGADRRLASFISTYQTCFQRFIQEHAFNTYILCLSEHEASNNDGRLSMWRGYGSNGNGAAIVFDSSRINYNEASPLIVAPVTYANTSQRRAWLDSKLGEVAKAIQASTASDEQLPHLATELFERIRIFALFTKHDGFKEEQEWRVAYMPDRDTSGRLHHQYHYAVGTHGVEPKLRFKLEHIEGVTTDDFSFARIVDRILLGPSISSDLTVTTVRRMLEQRGKPELSGRIFASSTPYRSR